MSKTTKIDLNKSIEEQLEGTPEEPKKLTKAEREALKRKQKSFTYRWTKCIYDDTIEALFKETSRLVGTMEDWRKWQVEEDRLAALRNYAGRVNGEFELIDQAVKYRNEIHRLRSDVNREIPWKISQAMARNDSEEVARLEARITQIKDEKMISLAFKIYRIWCAVTQTIRSDTDPKIHFEYSRYEDYNFEDDLE